VRTCFREYCGVSLGDLEDAIRREKKYESAKGRGLKGKGSNIHFKVGTFNRTGEVGMLFTKEERYPRRGGVEVKKKSDRKLKGG